MREAAGGCALTREATRSYARGCKRCWWLCESLSLVVRELGGCDRLPLREGLREAARGCERQCSCVRGCERCWWLCERLRAWLPCSAASATCVCLCENPFHSAPPASDSRLAAFRFAML
ncbi:hypothetical protein AMTRI_Chr10g20 [Amborella trichopoda]|uniref:Uncharacterized protein n=1 Tax=Amborella trichopoda TaxID=13333 RepID=W1NP36_AMBTC|nr:hypothetical protein AMTR_s00210p00014650 [Amborella trichopoda]